MTDYPLLHETGWLDVLLRHKGMDASGFALRFAGRKDWPVREIAEQLHCYPRAEAKLGELHRPGMIYLREALEQASGFAAATWRARTWLAVVKAEPTGRSKTTRVADLTGGLGIDTAAFALAGAQVDYCERNPMLAAIARHNHELLGLDTRIRWHTGDSMEWLATWKQGDLQQNSIQQDSSDPDCNQQDSNQQKASQQEKDQPEFRKLDLLYIDPSRRPGGKRVLSLLDSEPDITRHLARIRSAANRYLVKLSPMMDPVDAARSLEDCVSVTAVSVDGELKELLSDCIPVQSQGEHDHVEQNYDGAGRRPDPVFRAVMLDASGRERFRFCSDNNDTGSDADPETVSYAGPDTVSDVSPHAVSDPGPDTASDPGPHAASDPGPGAVSDPGPDAVSEQGGEAGSLLFEPDPALFKMRLIDEAARRYGLDRIHPEIGYLTSSDSAPGSFPGKVYRIRWTHPFKPRVLRKWLAENGLTRVHIHQRGFPLTVEELYKKLGCRMGEEAHLFATLSRDGQKALIVADRIG